MVVLEEAVVAAHAPAAPERWGDIEAVQCRRCVQQIKHALIEANRHKGSGDELCLRCVALVSYYSSNEGRGGRGETKTDSSGRQSAPRLSKQSRRTGCHQANL
eukprot:SAG31_NODE_8707_length_1402_cov_1.185725_3_plen_103_part_00